MPRDTKKDWSGKPRNSQIDVNALLENVYADEEAERLKKDWDRLSSSTNSSSNRDAIGSSEKSGKPSHQVGMLSVDHEAKEDRRRATIDQNYQRTKGKERSSERQARKWKRRARQQSQKEEVSSGKGIKRQQRVVDDLSHPKSQPFFEPKRLYIGVPYTTESVPPAEVVE
ncbi:hypothetical protein Ancab_010819 [Ancistrocladus abbreviatus]